VLWKKVFGIGGLLQMFADSGMAKDDEGFVFVSVHKSLGGAGPPRRWVFD